MDTSKLGGALQELRKRRMYVGAGVLSAWAVLAALGVMVLFVWIDLAIDLPANLRIGSRAVALVAAASVVFGSLGRLWQELKVSSMARKLDGCVSAGGQVVSGVDLMIQPPVGSALRIALAELAVDRAEAISHTIPSKSVVPAKPAYTAMGLAAGCILLLVTLSLVFPRIARTEWMRFIDPHGDHPPYSQIELAVEPGDARVIYGGNLEVFVKPDGGAVDRVELLVYSAANAIGETLPLFPEPQGRWRTTLTNITSDMRYTARAHSSRTRQFDVSVITVPKIEEVRFKIAPPEYTNLPPYSGVLPEGGILGLRNTKVTVTTKSNRPLGGGTLSVTAGRETTLVPMTAGAAPNETVGNFEIVQGGKMELFVTDKAGQNSQERFTAPIHLLLDDRPVVRIVEPPPVSLATPSAALPVVIDAEDDYGISSMEIYRSLNESRPTPETAAVPTPPPTRLAQPLTLPLSQYGLQPGDVIKLFARVQDNDPAGAKGTESDVVVVQIISDADFRRMMMSRQGLEVLQSKYQQARRRLESLAEEMKELEEELASQTPNDPTAREMREKLASLGQKMQEQAEAIHESAKNDLPLELDEKLRKELEKLGEELAKSASNMGELAEGKKSNEEARRKLEELRKKLDEQKREFDQNAMEPIEHFSKIFPLKQDESRFVQIYQRQRALEERMKSLKGQDLTGDPNVKARMRELEAEQRQIREALNDLLTDIENHAASLPDDPKLDKLRTQASEFAKAVRECNAGNNMTDAEAALAEFLGTRAHSNALAAADALEQFLSKCQSMGSEGKQCLSFQPGLGTSMSTSADQLLGMMGLSNGNNMGSGYSMNQNTPNNVGLYGNLPLAGDPRSGRGGDQQAGSGNGRSVGRGDRQNYWWLRGTDDGRAMGVGEEIVPVQYRRRVGQYFQRLADEVATPNSKSNSN